MDPTEWERPGHTPVGCPGFDPLPGCAHVHILRAADLLAYNDIVGHAFLGIVLLAFAAAVWSPACFRSGAWTALSP